MAEPSTARAPFRMVGARTAVLDGPNVEAIEQQIHTIESTLESVPDFAFDLSKTLVESVCKTVARRHRSAGRTLNGMRKSS